MNNVEISNLSNSEFKDMFQNEKLLITKNHDSSVRREILFEIQDIMDSMPIKFWLTNGTALGFRRDNDFIKWDDDIDLDTNGDDLILLFDSMVKKFLEAGFIVRPTKRNPNPKMNLFKNMEKVSIGGFKIAGDWANFKFYRFPKSFFQTTDKISYHGREFRVPGPIDDYLEFLYKDWKTPMNIDGDSDMYNINNIRR